MNTGIFEHYLITRFNLRKEDWKTSKSGSLVLTAEWLKNRFRLFEQFCLPSVESQVNQNFIWLIFFDTSTPPEYKQKITEYHARFPRLKPFYIDGMARFVPSVQSEIKQCKAPYIITTRMDNDDCISKYFVNEIQQHFDQQNYTALDFLDGYTLQITNRVKAGKRRQAYNPFISLIEKNVVPQSVWKQRHSYWKKEKNVKRISNKRIWMSVIHAENKKNEFVGYGNVDLKILFNDFTINDSVRFELINKQVNQASWKLESFMHKVSSHWRTVYKDIKRSLGLYRSR